MEQLKDKLKKQGGFTMVELLIVVAIIAILLTRPTSATLSA